MFKIVDIKALGIETLPSDGLPSRTQDGVGGLPGRDEGHNRSVIGELTNPRDSAGGGCPRCEGFRPHPRLDGTLKVDPEVRLPSPGMDVEAAYFYNSQSQANGPFGYGRTVSLNLTAQASCKQA